jgi:hypothetical protein
MEYVVCFVLGAATMWWLSTQHGLLRLQAAQEARQLAEQLGTLQKEWAAYEARVSAQVQAVTTLVNTTEAAVHALTPPAGNGAMEPRYVTPTDH